MNPSADQHVFLMQGQTRSGKHHVPPAGVLAMFVFTVPRIFLDKITAQPSESRRMNHNNIKSTEEVFFHAPNYK